MSGIIPEFLGQSIYRITENTPKIISSLNELTEEQVWDKPNEISNSIGNLILHLCGNISQYILSALDLQPDKRERDKEFSTKGGFDKNLLTVKLAATVDQAVRIIENMDETRLMKKYSVQGFQLSGVGIIVHVTEHYSYHTGQIIYRAKQITAKDPGFYKHVDLNRKNEL
jgi:uncharacterized damage-inducible protein DinB